MADNMSTDDDNTTFANTEVSIPRPIRFWLLLLFNIPALLCTVFLLYHLLINRTLRQALHNHVIIVLLIIALLCNVIDIPAYITFLYFGYVWISTPAFCNLWWFIDIGLFDMIAMLMAFAAMERHILVFYHRWVSTRRKRFLFHYLPLLILIIYNTVAYLILIIFPPCENLYDYSQPWCSYPCYYGDTNLAMYDEMVNCIFPTLLIIIFSIALFLRYIRQKRRLQRRVRWRKLRKMMIQLLLISSLYLIFYLPLLILTTAHLCGLPAEIGADAELYTYFLSYFVVLLSPYVCLASLPELWKKFRIGCRGRLQLNNTVIPHGTQNR